MDGVELRQRLDRFDRSYTRLASLLGLSVTALLHQMRSVRRVLINGNGKKAPSEGQ
jgi:hypothetical protein